MQIGDILYEVYPIPHMDSAVDHSASPVEIGGIRYMPMVQPHLRMFVSRIQIVGIETVTTELEGEFPDDECYAAGTMRKHYYRETHIIDAVFDRNGEIEEWTDKNENEREIRQLYVDIDREVMEFDPIYCTLRHEVDEQIDHFRKLFVGKMLTKVKP